MILIPEIETVVILVPRTGTGTLRRAIARQYPRAQQLYRHMEADGVPYGYDRWRKVGVVRDPLARLWSLYKFLRDFDGPHNQCYLAAQRMSVRIPFDRWIVENLLVFTSPYDSEGWRGFHPQYACRHPIPENRKSQFIYLRPDLGTQIVPYSTGEIYSLLGVSEIERVHVTDKSEPMPVLSDKAYLHMNRFFEWDAEASGASLT